ncbi:MAG: hypothetical protein K8H84_07790 [Sulfuricella denitrificans]|nr:hypothetical protein [Sulfuricella denitrificans]
MAKTVKGIPPEKLITLAGPDWVNFSFGRDGLFYIEGWRRGFTPGEIRAQFYQVQLVRALTHQAATAKADTEKAIQSQQEAEKRAAWYRSQLVLESRMGMALARITG